MKRALTGIAAAAVVLGTIAPAAFASTTYTVGGRKAISVNGVVKSQPYTLVQKENGIPTSYMGVWYLGQAIQAAGGSYTWNASTKTFSITVSGVDATKLNIPGGVGTGNTTIVVNGVTVKKVNSFAAKDPAGGTAATTFIPIFYLGEVFGKLGGSSWDGSTFSFKNFATLAIKGANEVGIGQAETLSLAATNNGTSTTVTGDVKWSVAGDGAVIDPSTGKFIASAAGNYTVTANYDGQTVTATVSVYGAATSLKVTASKTSLVANGASTDTVTVTAVDANGNAVLNYKGSAKVISTQFNNAFAIATTDEGQSSSYDSSLGQVDFTNGVATLVLTAGSVPGVTGTVNFVSNDITDANNVLVTSSVDITTEAQKATSIQVTNADKYVAVNADNTTTFNVNVLDQDGQVMNGGLYNLKASISGGGTFTDGTKSDELVQVLSTSGQNVVVDAPKGVSGNYTLTVTGTGLTSGSASVYATTAQNPAKLLATVATSSSSTITQATDPTVAGSMVLDLATADANNVPTGTGLVSGHSYELYLTDSKGNAFSAKVDAGAGAITAATDGGYVIPATAATVTISDNQVLTADAGNYTATLKDITTTTGVTALGAAAAVPFTIKADTAHPALLNLSTSDSVVSASKPSTTVTAQITDAAGNPVADNGLTVEFTATNTTAVATALGSAKFNSGAYSAAPYADQLVDASGKATATFTPQVYAGNTWSIAATILNTGTGISNPTPVTVYLSQYTTNSFKFQLKDTSTTSTYKTSTVYAQAGDPVNVAAWGTAPAELITSAVDANGNPVDSTHDSVTLTINHASGLKATALPTTAGTTTVGVNVTAALNTTSDTLTLSGTMQNVSDFVYGLGATAGKAGTVTFSLSDTTTGATGAAAITVVPSTVATGLAVVAPSTGSATGATQFTVELVDAGGNPVVATADTTVGVTVTTGTGETIENSGYKPTTTVTIAKGTSSATAYLVGSGSADSSVVITATYGGLTDGVSGTIALN